MTVLVLFVQAMVYKSVFKMTGFCARQVVLVGTPCIMDDILLGWEQIVQFVIGVLHRYK